MDLFDKITASAEWLHQKMGLKAVDIAIQLGTGMAPLLESIAIENTIPYNEIPHFVQSTAPSHTSQLISGKIHGRSVIVFAGRFHYYEGYPMQSVVFPVYVCKALNCKRMLLTNAAGSVNPAMREGAIVALTDHINMMHDNPLRGKNDDRIGPRFPDMANAYDKTGLSLLSSIASKLDVMLHRGTYLGLSGPNYETDAEYRMARILGADVVGMSTVPEVIAAAHCGLPMNALSIVSNQFDPEHHQQDTDMEEVLATVRKSAQQLRSIIEAFVKII